MSHTEELSYACGHCTKKFTTINKLKYHMNTHHMKIGEHKCTACNKAFPSMEDLKRHTLSHLLICSKENM